MKKFVLLLYVVIAFSAKGQTNVYHPFPDSNAFWTIYSYVNVPNGCQDYGYSQESIGGDTVIGSHTYKKIVGTNLCYYPNDSCRSGNGVTGYIRQDTALRRVYTYCEDNFLCPTHTDTLLYDFNVAVGDTLKSILTCINRAIVGSIDSILVGSNYRKKINLNTCQSNTFIIEGIGNNAGPLGIPYSWSEVGEYLACFKSNNDTVSFLPPDMCYSCAATTSIKEPADSDNRESFLSPNPFHSSATLSISDSRFTKGDLKIYDVMGQLVQQQIITHQSTIINRKDLCDGLYFYRISNNEGLTLTGKFVVN